MEKIIQHKLEKIERQEGIKILFAIESGSRAWGFSSEDSDFDVRFVYVRSKNEYLQISELPDFLNLPINNMLDINGWDVKKFLKLLYASNATPFEWMQSPIVYAKDGETFETIKKILPDYFCQRSLIHHYLGLVSKMFANINNSEIRLKTLFYIFRSLLAAKFVHETNAYPPMEFSELLKQINDVSILNETKRLLELKSKSSDKQTVVINDRLKKYLIDLNLCLSNSEKIKRKGTFNSTVLNKIYRKIINAHDHNKLFKTT